MKFPVMFDSDINSEGINPLPDSDQLFLLTAKCLLNIHNTTYFVGESDEEVVQQPTQTKSSKILLVKRDALHEVRIRLIEENPLTQRNWYCI
jgi:hypothetical protein